MTSGHYAINAGLRLRAPKCQCGGKGDADKKCFHVGLLIFPRCNPTWLGFLFGHAAILAGTCKQTVSNGTAL